MRKMKKINGFLVVRFNDREKRDYPDLGSFGIIDAELYTGDLDLDLGEMEYTDADSIEVAVEQARGLDAEEDFDEEPVAYSIVTETENSLTEARVEPRALALACVQRLEEQIESKKHPDINPITVAHELKGYKTALVELGLMDEDEAEVEPDSFPYYALMVMRISEGEASFSSEIQNEPIDPENCAFAEEWFDYYDEDGKTVPDFSESKFIFVGANDPSLGKNRKSDTWAVIFTTTEKAFVGDPSTVTPPPPSPFLETLPNSPAVVADTGRQ